MRYLKLFLILTSGIILSSCATTRNYVDAPQNWSNIVVADDVEIYVNIPSIKREGSMVYAYERRVFVSPESQKRYVDKIRDAYSKMGKPEKADKWKDFSYCVYYSKYDCTNKRYQILSVEDYDNTGKLIAKTEPNKDNMQWISVEEETVGDYTFFYVCDFDS